MHPAPDLDPIAFDPVPTASTRHDGWTPARQRAFIDALAQCGMVGAAAGRKRVMDSFMTVG